MKPIVDGVDFMANPRLQPMGEMIARAEAHVINTLGAAGFDTEYIARSALEFTEACLDDVAELITRDPTGCIIPLDIPHPLRYAKTDERDG